VLGSKETANAALVLAAGRRLEIRSQLLASDDSCLRQTLSGATPKKPSRNKDFSAQCQPCDWRHWQFSGDTHTLVNKMSDSPESGLCS
jgi:hypothetical protein